ncbi:phosphopantetheine-binding protein [Streptomyces sp. NPDC052644]|uniref:acyl carrier protein n=1 Tax=unclassified Streptomyces TaxID=2593676 RepID=UPI00343EDC86
MADIGDVRSVLTDLGIAAELLRGDARLRADLGLDSVDLSQLQVELAEAHGVRFDPWTGHDPTVREVAALVREATADVELPELPLTGIGKVDKARLRADIRARETTPPY